MENSRVTLGQFLRNARESKGLTLRAVENAAGISNAYLSQLENGRIRRPSPVMLHKLSELYEVSYSEIMALAGYPLPDESQKASGFQHPASRIGPVSEEEETALIEYLAFLRSRGKRRKVE